MAWTPLKDRLDKLPLILCGPILRRTESDSVTVWVALKEERTVTLRVYSRAGATDLTHLTLRLVGTRTTVELGKHLHVVAVTAKPVEASKKLVPGEIYFYDLVFPDCNSDAVPEDSICLKTPGIVNVEGTPASAVTKLYYPETYYEQLPSFSLPPNDLNKLRIIHGSCRKPHNEGLDAMPAIDEMLLVDWPVADERPHMLLLTGDQIYADDMAHTMLHLLMDAEKMLLGWTESLPEVSSEEAMEPGKRTGIVKNVAGFTSEDAENHLIRWGEFCAMYLFTWSNVLWPQELPKFKDVVRYKYPITITESSFKEESTRLQEFQEALPKVRRALANVPTYMIFDDHDITDDWYMTKEWCETVLKKPLGRRIVQNGLLAYSIFQAWGNTPEQFNDAVGGENQASVGKALLDATEIWSQSQGNNPQIDRQIAGLLGLPQSDKIFTRDEENGQNVLDRPSDALRWNFTVIGQEFEIIFLDTRTRRAYSDKPKDQASMLSLTALKEQIQPAQNQKSVTIVIATTPVIEIPVLHPEGLPLIVRWYMHFQKHGIYYYDNLDHWKNQDDLFETFLAMMASRWNTFDRQKARVVILTGDIHFAAISRLQYQSDILYKGDLESPTTFKRFEAIFAQFCSSAFKKQSKLTRHVHDHGYVFTFWFWVPVIGTLAEYYIENKLPESSQWFGWRQPVALGESLKGPSTLFEHYENPRWMANRSPALVKAGEVEDDVTPKPHWRYRIDYILAENEVREPAPFTPEEIIAPSPGDRKEALKTYMKLARNHQDYARKWGSGKELVGLNNVGEIFFDWGVANKAVIQNSWWRLKSKSENEEFLQPFPLSKFRVPFEFQDRDFEMPKMSDERSSG